MQTHHPIRNNDPRVIRLDRGFYTTCTIILKGASITSWRIENAEQLFLSRSSCLDDFAKYRGGITIFFPHFNDWTFGRRSGFARDLMWSLEREPFTDKFGDVHVTFSLESNCFTKSCWNYEFKLLYSITLKTNELETQVELINVSPGTFEFNLALHWQFRVTNLSQVFVTGVKGLQYAAVDEKNAIHKYLNDTFRLNGSEVITFQNSPNELMIYNPEEHKVIKVSKKNLPDFNVWNPGLEFSKLSSLEADEINCFIGADVGNLLHKDRLKPNSSFKISLTFEVTKTDRPPPKYGHFFDYFDDAGCPN